MKVIRKPKSFDARMVTHENYEEVAEWCRGFTHVREDNFEKSVSIMDLSCMQRAYVGDYIIKIDDFEFEVIKQWQFETFYEVVEE